MSLRSLRWDHQIPAVNGFIRSHSSCDQLGMENEGPYKNSGNITGLKRDGSSGNAETMDEVIMANDNSVIGNTDSELLTKKRIDSYLTEWNRNNSVKLLLAVRISDGLCYGIAKEDDSVIVLFSGNYLMRVNPVTKSLHRCEGCSWKEIPHSSCLIDMDANGRRWEGGVRNSLPFGYGTLYDEEGRREYEGFMMDGIKACYGIEYYPDINLIKYDGCYYDDKRFGMGVLYDRKGVIEHDGLWKNDKPHSSEFDGTMDNRMESITIPDNSFNEVESFVFPSFLVSLKRINIGDDCFGSVRSLILAGMAKLESVRIGKRCFTHATAETNMFVETRADGTLEIVDCPSLKSIEIKDFSFADYHTLELENLPALQHIVFGSHCFHWSYMFSLAGTPFRLLIGRIP